MYNIRSWRDIMAKEEIKEKETKKEKKNNNIH